MTRKRKKQTEKYYLDVLKLYIYALCVEMEK